MRYHPEHPADLEGRVNLRWRLHTLRERQGLTCTDLSRLAGFGNLDAVRNLERKMSWEIPRVQQWTRALDRRLILDIEGITVPETDLDAEILRLGATFGARDEDARRLQIVCDDLIRTRMATCPLERFAARVGVDSTAVRDWEDRHENTLLRVVQRYARALGGSVELDLERVGVEVSS